MPSPMPWTIFVSAPSGCDREDEGHEWQDREDHEKGSRYYSRTHGQIGLLFRGGPQF
jgi:hypothetical protein